MGRDNVACTPRSRARTAARRRDDSQLLEIVTAALAAGTDREDILNAGYAAQDEIQQSAGGEDDPAEDHLLDIMDRLVGWCPPGAAL
ncbi:hypothetical protein ACQPXB_46905 [Amycolatopsis sp. CA-161197]|uniref:hypothetical protein n=1 Tax=Amycolatopsis sp. CA-161197 TaxID=3239922 RepID=UPI003D8E7CC6